MVIKLINEEKQTIKDFETLFRFKRRLRKYDQTRIEKVIMEGLNSIELTPLKIAEIKAIIKNRTDKKT